MKTFSMIKLFTIFCLSVSVLLIGNTDDVYAQDTLYSLEVIGALDREYKVNEIATGNTGVTFVAKKDGIPTSNIELEISYDSRYIGSVSYNPANRTTDDFGRLNVSFTAIRETPNKNPTSISAKWKGEEIEAKVSLNIKQEGHSPVTIVVNSPNPKSDISVGSTFTQDITIENNGKYSTLPLSAYQMSIVFNPYVLEVVNVTEGTFLEKDGVDAFWEPTIGTGVINVVQARIGQEANSNPPPDNVAKAPSPAGISLAPNDPPGKLLSIRFRVLAVAEETLGIHNVRLQSSQREDRNGDGRPDVNGKPLRISYAIKVLDAFVTTHQQFFAKEDVNQDEYVNILDLVMVAANIGASPVSPHADVNGDGFVNVLDLIMIYQSPNWGEKTGKREEKVNDSNEPPPLAPLAKGNVDTDMIKGWIDLAQNEDNGSVIFDKGIENLKSILVSKKPTETRLLRNYPNPFNPETWIPYQLEKGADVTVTIHSINGSPIRTLKLGHQSAGLYQSKSRAVYWDGRNEFGEQAASGLYFYTLTAGKFSATRKMLILK